MYALVDCNSFFCSVEKAFHPGLDGRPVCVLSSNDGCIVALTNEAKAVGLHRGDPIFKVKDIVQKNDVKLFSSNMMLYAAMSKRIVSILRDSVAYVENYSIDESFCDLTGYEQFHDLGEYMREVARKIRLWTDIPVSVGVAPTKTLAKMGSKFAKKYPGYRSVCLIDTDAKRRKALELFDLADVWGVGRRSLEKLHRLGVSTPLQLADKPGTWVEDNFTKPMVQTWKELNGYPCIDTHEILQRQCITTSRSFGEMISDLDDVKASVASFAASCANKLRAQASVAGTLTVFLSSNPFREELQQYFNSATYVFPVSTSDTVEMTSAAMKIVESIYRPGICYKKSGVILGCVTSSSAVQQILFDRIKDRQSRHELSCVMDQINHRYGLKTIRLAVEGDACEAWKVKCDYRSPNYLTSLDEILSISI